MAPDQQAVGATVMEKKNIRLSAEQRDNLVAYLDRELDDGSTQQIDAVLARSEVARHEVEALARTWELLDLLQKPTAREDFTERTITTLKVSEMRTRLVDQPWMVHVRKGAIGVAWVVGLALFGSLGYWITSTAIPNVNTEFLTQLPLLRNLDIYPEVDSVDFVRQLQRLGEFGPTDAEPQARRVVDDTPLTAERKVLDERYLAVVAEPQSERDHLRRNWEAYQKLPPDRQRQLWDLHQQLCQEPSTVWDVIRVYGFWLQTLTPGQRDDLRRAQGSAAKLDLVKRFLSDQAANRDQMLFSLDDIEQHKLRLPPPPYFNAEELAAMMPVLFARLGEVSRRSIDREAPEPSIERYGRIFGSVVRDYGPPQRWLDETAVNELIAAVPDEGVRQSLERATPFDRKRAELIGCLIRGLVALTRQELNAFFPTPQQLQQTFVSQDGDTRTELMQKSPQDLVQELVKLYFKNLDDPKFRRIEASKNALEMAARHQAQWQPGGPRPQGSFRRGPLPPRGDGPPSDGPQRPRPQRPIPAPDDLPKF